GIYETPGGTILLHAHRAIESITLDRESAHLKDEIMPKYAKLIYNGYWWTTERKMLQSLIDKSQEKVNGTVRIKLYKGSVVVVGRKSNNSLYSYNLASFDSESQGYDHKDAEGFIKVNSLRLKKS
ncbi:argininosuccinate synthase, partial [Ehrlichia ruminantium]